MILMKIYVYLERNGEHLWNSEEGQSSGVD